MTTALLSRKELCTGTWEFTLAKPAGIAFLAGQHINLRLPYLIHEDARGGRRTFTLASAPHEEHWLIATRMTGSGYKKTLLELPLGSALHLEGPMGSLTCRDDSSTGVFLAAGIGITPFRSMTLDIMHQARPTPIKLFYGNRNRSSAAYHDLFLQQSRQTHFTYIPTFNHEPDASWHGERRSLGQELVQSHLTDVQQPLYYLCGPPALVADLLTMLQSLHVKKEKILTESFWGYP
jgi:ferredoxin-NADP reductase